MSIVPSDLGFDLLPPDPVNPNPDLALAAALIPEVTFDPETFQPLGKSWLFDFMTGQFIMRGSSPAESFELDTLAMWVNKCLITERGAHPIYSDDFGIEAPFELVGQVLDGSDMAEYQEAISEALLVHDRIVAVEDFEFNQPEDDDAVYVSFTVVIDSPSEINDATQSLVFTNVPVVTQ